MTLSACSFSKINEKEKYTADGFNDQFSDEKVYLDENAPVITFVHKTHDESGTPEFYLFDDNPEHLNPKFLADGNNPSSIAHFENLKPGIYTVFSYHHRGNSVGYDEDLYYDTVFSSDTGGKFEILAIGLDHDWDWNQAWADYTNTKVFMPEYIRSNDCTCGENCECMKEDGICPNDDCPAIIRNKEKNPNTYLFDNLNKPVKVSKPIFLSDMIRHIQNNDINKFRYGGYDEPMWLMMKFRVINGNINFDTIAYQNKQEVKDNFKNIKKGAFDNEPQYKGIAYNAPVGVCEFEYTITDDTPTGNIPVTVINQRVPNGCTIKDGKFATYVNTWREKYPITAESDMVKLEYTDNTKTELYGKNSDERDNIWYFDPYHTKIYDNLYDENEKSLLNSYNIKTDHFFEPNGLMENVNHPLGNEMSDDDFYKYTACNLGNFGVTEKYVIHIKNSGGNDRKFKFNMKSIAGQVYKFKQTDADGNVVYDDGGMYYMKKFDDDPAEDPNSKTEPKERIKPPEHGSDIVFDIKGGEEYTAEIEITTLTGCTAPMHNTMSIE